MRFDMDSLEEFRHKTEILICAAGITDADVDKDTEEIARLLMCEYDSDIGKPRKYYAVARLAVMGAVAARRLFDATKRAEEGLAKAQLIVEENARMKAEVARLRLVEAEAVRLCLLAGEAAKIGPLQEELVRLQDELYFAEDNASSRTLLAARQYYESKNGSPPIDPALPPSTPPTIPVGLAAGDHRSEADGAEERKLPPHSPLPVPATGPRSTHGTEVPETEPIAPSYANPGPASKQIVADYAKIGLRKNPGAALPAREVYGSYVSYVQERDLGLPLRPGAFALALKKCVSYRSYRPRNMEGKSITSYTGIDFSSEGKMLYLRGRERV